MDDDEGRCITLVFPRAEDFEEGAACISVPYHTVSATIELLQGCIAQWKAEEGSVADETRWRALMAAAGLALGKLVEAYAVHNTEAGARRLVDQIHWFLSYNEVREHLEAIRDDDSTAHIVDALLALQEQHERRRKTPFDELAPTKQEFVHLLAQISGAPAYFELLVDSLPGAIDAGCADRVLACLLLWGAHRRVYPFERAMRYAVRVGRAYDSGKAGHSD